MNTAAVKISDDWILANETRNRQTQEIFVQMWTNGFQFTLSHQMFIRNYYKCTCRCTNSQIIDRDDLYQDDENEQKMQLDVH